jgi:hypothetical protein
MRSAYWSPRLLRHGYCGAGAGIVEAEDGDDNQYGEDHNLSDCADRGAHGATPEPNESQIM